MPLTPAIMKANKHPLLINQLYPSILLPSLSPSLSLSFQEGRKEGRRMAMSLTWVAAAVAAVVLSMGWREARADVAGDRAECADQLVGLATCLPYVQGNAKAPTPDCCTGLKGVLAKSPKCLCVLIKDRDNPQLGIKINVSLALSLPTACSVPADISKCPSVLKLPPNSADAQIFKQPAAKAGQTNATSSNGNLEGNVMGAHESNGGRTRHLARKEWLVIIGSMLLLLLRLMVFAY